MIEAIIFDFGDVFIDLNKQAIDTEFRKLGLTAWHDDLDALNKKYEIGKIDEFEFMQGFQKYLPNVELVDIRAAWNPLVSLGIFTNDFFKISLISFKQYRPYTH